MPGRKRRTRRAAMVVPVLAAALGLSACGGDDGRSPAGEGAAKAASNAPKLSGDPIKVMTITSINAETSVYKNIAESARAYGEWVNKNGGIKGAPLQVDVCDDRGTPTAAADCARKASSDGYVAVVGSFSFFGDAFMPRLTKAGVSHFGFCCALTAPELTAKNAFPFGSQPIYAAGEVMRAVQDGCKNINAVIQEGTEAVLPVLEGAMKSYGRKFGTIVTLPGAAPDYGPHAVKATGDGADCITAFLAETVQTRWNSALVQSGAKVRQYALQGNLNEVSLEGLGDARDGDVVVGMLPDMTLPMWATYRQALKDANADPDLDYNSLGGLGTWAGYVGFRKVAEAIPGAPDAITAKTFLRQAGETTDLDVDGMYPTLNLKEGWPEADVFGRLSNRKTIFGTIKGGKVVPLTREFVDVGNLALGQAPRTDQQPTS